MFSSTSVLMRKVGWGGLQQAGSTIPYSLKCTSPFSGSWITPQLEFPKADSSCLHWQLPIGSCLLVYKSISTRREIHVERMAFPKPLPFLKTISNSCNKQLLLFEIIVCPKCGFFMSMKETRITAVCKNILANLSLPFTTTINATIMYSSVLQLRLSFSKKRTRMAN